MELCACQVLSFVKLKECFLYLHTCLACHITIHTLNIGTGIAAREQIV